MPLPLNKKRPAAATGADSMPPSSSSAAAAAKRKRVSIGGSSVMGEPASSETRAAATTKTTTTTTTHASGRPKRSGVGEPTYNNDKSHRHKSTVAKARSAAAASSVKSLAVVRPRGRGRPRKNAPAAVHHDDDEEDEEENAPTPPAKPATKTFGRPKKSTAAPIKSNGSPEATGKQAVKQTTPPSKTEEASAARPRGRPKGTQAKTAVATATARPAEKPDSESKSAKAGQKAATSTAQADEELDGLTANESERDEVYDDEGKQYWLMKAEPDSRIENGVDVKFSIDDLKNAEKPEGWDGVRNLVARNRLRAMKKGDLAFFYHSNTKIPGVAGVMEIVEEHSIDESAFNPASPYYHPKSSRDKPKWELVHVRFVRKFSTLVPLSELRKHAQVGGGLQDLEMLRQGRLSVSAIKPKEWRFILDLASDGNDDDFAAVKGQPIKVKDEGAQGANDG